MRTPRFNKRYFFRTCRWQCEKLEARLEEIRSIRTGIEITGRVLSPVYEGLQKEKDELQKGEENVAKLKKALEQRKKEPVPT